MKIKPWFALFLLAPAFGEVASGSTPPVKFWNVPGLVAMCLLYGGGALLIREIVVRWKKGWLTLLLFGAAYGVIEEGIMCKSFFDPHWPDINELGVYGRALGVNWVWSYFLTVFHAMFSIGFSILIAEALYAGVAKEKWLDVRGVKWIAGAFIGVVLLGFFFMPTNGGIYHPRPHLVAGALLVIAGLVFLGWYAPKPESRENKLPAPLAAFAAAGAASPYVFFITMYVSSHSRMHPAAYLLLADALFSIYVWGLIAMSDFGRSWGAQERFAFTAGVLGGMISSTMLLEIGLHFARGMVLTAAAEFALIVLLARRLRAQFPPPCPQNGDIVPS